MIEAELADGRILEFPDGTDPSVIQATVKKMVAQNKPLISPEVAAHPATRVGYGAAAAPIGGAQLAAEGLSAMPAAMLPTPLQAVKGALTGVDLATGKKDAVANAIKDKLREYEQSKATGREMRGEDPKSFDWWELGGMATTPLSLGRGAAVRLPEEASRLAKTAAMGAEGAGYGLAMPTTEEDYAKAKVKQALIGGGFGLGVGGATEAGKAFGGWLSEGIKPLYKKGIESDIVKYLSENFDVGKDKVVKALRDAMPDETSAQAVSRANKEALKRGETVPFGRDVVSTEMALAKRKGGAELMSKPTQQELERGAIIGDIAKTPEIRKQLKDIASWVDEAKYDKAANYAIKGDPKLAQVASNPFFKKEIKKAGELMKANPDEPQTLTTFLHNMKLSLDAKLSAPAGTEKAIAGKERATVQKLKKQIVGWLENKNPAYKDARVTHQELMKPINRIDVGKQLQDSLKNSKDDEALVSFLNAINKAPQTIKKATGQTMYDDIGQILTPEQKTGVDIVTESLKNKAFMEGKKMKGVNQLGNLSAEVKFELPHILSRPVVVTNAILKRLGHSKGAEYEAILADIMNNPQKLADYLELPKTSPLQKKAQVVVDYLNNVGAMQAGKSAGEQE